MNFGRLPILRTLIRPLVRSSHIGWALADQVVVSSCNFFSSILLARILGIEEFGRYVLAWMIVLFVQNIQYSAISTATLSIGPKHDTAGSELFYNAQFLQQVIFGLVSALLTWFGGLLVGSIFPGLRLYEIALALAAAVLWCQTQDFIRRYFFSIGRPKISFIIDAVRYLGLIAALLTWYGTARAALTSEAVLWMATVAAAVASLLVIPYLPRLKWFPASVAAISLRNWHFSKWLIASTLLVWVIGNLFFVATGILLGAAAVGAMRAAQSLVGMAHIVIEAAVNVIPARASREFALGGRGRLLGYLKQVAVHGGIATTLLAGIFAVTPEFWLRLLFGDQFAGYGALVRWWAAVEVMVFLGLVIGAWLRTLEHTKPIFSAYALSAGLSIVLAYPLIAYFGVAGAVAGVLIANIIQIIYLLISIKSGTR